MNGSDTYRCVDVEGGHIYHRDHVCDLFWYLQLCFRRRKAYLPQRSRLWSVLILTAEFLLKEGIFTTEITFVSCSDIYRCVGVEERYIRHRDHVCERFWHLRLCTERNATVLFCLIQEIDPVTKHIILYHTQHFKNTPIIAWSLCVKLLLQLLLFVDRYIFVTTWSLAVLNCSDSYSSAVCKKKYICNNVIPVC